MSTNPPTVSDRLAQLEQQQALQTEALRRLCEARVIGAEGAAAIVDALDPAKAGQWTPVPFEPGE